MAQSALDKFQGAQFSANLKLNLANHFWLWYEAHQNDEITKVGIFIFNFTIKVKTVRPLFKLLFGDPPMVENTLGTTPTTVA